MEAKAVGRFLRVPPRKARYVLDTVRGKGVDEALAMLKFMPNAAARLIEGVLESAVANAVHNYSMDREVLRLSRAYVDQGPSLKRIKPRAMGRAYRILKRMSHVTVVVAEDETLRKPIEKPEGRRAGTKRPVSETTKTPSASGESASPRVAKRANRKATARTRGTSEMQHKATTAPKAEE